MFADIKQCPNCSRAIPLEQGHRTKRSWDGWFETLIVCGFCGIGWYTLWERFEGSDRLDYTLTYEERTEPEAFSGFVREIEQRTGLEIDLCSYAA